MTTTVDEEDAKLLKYAGAMGHQFVTIVGKPGERRVRCESTTLDSAKNVMPRDRHVRVYSTAGGKRKKWLCCFDGDGTDLAAKVATENGEPTYTCHACGKSSYQLGGRPVCCHCGAKG